MHFHLNLDNLNAILLISFVAIFMGCSSPKKTTALSYPGAVPQIEFCSLQGHMNEMVHLTAKYTVDKKLRSSENQQCAGMNVVELAFDGRDLQSEKFKAMMNEVNEVQQSPVLLIEAIGMLELERGEPKFVVKELIGVRRSN